MQRTLLKPRQLVQQEQFESLNNSLKSPGFSSPVFSPASSIPKRFSFESNNVELEEQKKLIMRLKQENESIKETLEQTELSSEKDDNSPTLHGNYEQAIEREEQRIAELNRQLELAFENINARRHVVGELHEISGNPVAMQKQLNILEAKLEKGHQKFNEALNSNKQLRNQVDTLRCERVIFDNLYKKLQREVDKENCISEVPEDDDQENKSSPKKKLQEFRPESQKLMSNAGVAEKLRKYEEDIAKIQAAFSNIDLQDFTATLVKKEEQNVLVFKEVNDLTSEASTLEKAIADVKQEKKKYIEEMAKYDIKVKGIKEMKDSLKRLERKNAHYESKCEEADNTLNMICQTVGGLFDSLNCKNVAPETMDSKAIDENNLMSFFGILDERAIQVTTAYLDKKRVESSYSVPLQYLTDSSLLKSKKEALSYIEYSDDEDEEIDTPFSMDDFMKKAMAKLDSTQASPMLSDIVSPVKSKK